MFIYGTNLSGRLILRKDVVAEPAMVGGEMGYPVDIESYEKAPSR